MVHLSRYNLQSQITFNFLLLSILSHTTAQVKNRVGIYNNNKIVHTYAITTINY